MHDRQLLMINDEVGEDRDLAPTARTKSSIKGNKLKKLKKKKSAANLTREYTICVQTVRGVNKNKRKIEATFMSYKTNVTNKLQFHISFFVAQQSLRFGLPVCPKYACTPFSRKFPGHGHLKSPCMICISVDIIFASVTIQSRCIR
jgi:hypothetical protein